MAKQNRKPIPKKIKKKGLEGIVHIQVTFNNTIITITNLKGEVISWSSAGACGFKGSRKATPFAAKTAAEEAARRSIEKGLKQVQVKVKGPGSGRDTALRALKDAGLQITVMRDITPLPHNGCRPPKKRRI